MRSRWKRIRYRLEWLGLILAAKLVPLCSRRVCCHVARAAGALLSFLDRHRYRIAVNNLEAAFGDRFSPAERRRIARQSFQYFARTMVDLLWSPRLTAQNFSQYIEWQNFEETARDTGPERSIIIACYHYGNFEWLSLACGFLDLKGTIISQEFKNSSLDPIFKKLREQSGHELIPRERGIIRLYKVLRRKGRTALLVDLTVPPSQGAVAITCFGLKTSVTSAHAWLHEQTGAAIIPAHCDPLPDGRYRLVFHPKITVASGSLAGALAKGDVPSGQGADKPDALRIRTTHKPPSGENYGEPRATAWQAAHTRQNGAGATHQQIAQACWNSFEPYVNDNPAPWLWMYKHWRYLPAKPDRPYPFYANFYRPFEDMLEKPPPETKTNAECQMTDDE